MFCYMVLAELEDGSKTRMVRKYEAEDITTRLQFLELINNWNRGATFTARSYIYVAIDEAEYNSWRV